MLRFPEKQISVARFSELFGITIDHIYFLLSRDVLRAIPGTGKSVKLDLNTQRIRYTIFRKLKEIEPRLKVDTELVFQIDQYEKDVLKNSGDFSKVQIGDPNAGKLPSLADSKMRREHALARKAELDCAAREGELVSRDAVISKWKGVALKVRSALLAIPDRISPVIAGELDSHKVHHLLTEELKYVLRNLSFNLQKSDNEEEVSLQDEENLSVEDNVEMVETNENHSEVEVDHGN